MEFDLVIRITYINGRVEKINLGPFNGSNKISFDIELVEHSDQKSNPDNISTQYVNDAQAPLSVQSNQHNMRSPAQILPQTQIQSVASQSAIFENLQLPKCMVCGHGPLGCSGKKPGCLAERHNPIMSMLSSSDDDTICKGCDRNQIYCNGKKDDCSMQSSRSFVQDDLPNCTVCGHGILNCSGKYPGCLTHNDSYKSSHKPQQSKQSHQHILNCSGTKSTKCVNFDERRFMPSQDVQSTSSTQSIPITLPTRIPQTDYDNERCPGCNKSVLLCSVKHPACKVYHSSMDFGSYPSSLFVCKGCGKHIDKCEKRNLFCKAYTFNK